MNKLILAALAGALALLATPASAQHHGHRSHGHGHSSHGHSSHGHVSHHSHHSYQKPVHHAYHKPAHSSHHTPSYQQPVHHTYHKPHYVKPAYVETTTSYEKRPAYVYQKVAGYCLDAVKTHGYNQHRKTVECKAGEYQKPEPKVAHVEPAPAPEPAPEQPQQ